MFLIPHGLSDTALEDVLLSGARAVPLDGTLMCSDSVPRYLAVPERRGAALGGLLQCAAELLRRQALKSLLSTSTLGHPSAVRDYLRVHFQQHDTEAFVVVFLSCQHRVIGVEEMFRGTLTQTSVYPREVVRRALSLNAAAIVMAHNHPSGDGEPSRADEFLTTTIKSALTLVDVRLLDHFIVAAGGATSMAERGLL